MLAFSAFDFSGESICPGNCIIVEWQAEHQWRDKCHSVEAGKERREEIMALSHNGSRDSARGQKGYRNEFLQFSTRRVTKAEQRRLFQADRTYS
jgi:hypothetical protein